MKSVNIVIMAILGALALSVASTRGQALNLTGATFEGALTNQVLTDSGSGANDGTVSTWVYNDPSVDSHGYIFIYQLENQGPDEITGANFNNYTLSQYMGSESYSNIVVLPGSRNPTVSLIPNFTFDTVTTGGAATFNGGLDMGAVSWFIVIDTDVSSFNTGFGLAQDNFQAHGEILAPNFAVFGVPEPPSAILLLAGCACFYGILRCRRAIE